jgi:ATP-dependent Clp protease protease subunit
MIFNKSKRSNKFSEELDDDLDEEKTDTPTPPFIKEDDESRLIGLYGEVEELKVSQIIGTILDMGDTALVEVPKDPSNPDSEMEEIAKPIEFIISTPGGNADDMFALYDILRVVREKCDIITYGIGKVMSAGVLILASGTKGKRKIGKNCRVMIHSVVAGSSGPFHSLQNEMSEIKHMQKSYIQALSDETNMSVKQLNTMINKKVNVYLSAEEAVKLGIADIIV